MPVLEVMHLTGHVDRHELSKDEPILIGSHSTNDIVIDDESVELMHCRISWNKGGFEAVAAGVEGLDVNGTIVQRATLKSGDVLRFGTVDIRYQADGEATAGEASSRQSRETQSEKSSRKSESPAKGTKRSTSQAAESGGGGGLDWGALEALASEERGTAASPRKRSAGPEFDAEPAASSKGEKARGSRADATAKTDVDEERDDAEGAERPGKSGNGSRKEKPADRLRTALRAQRYRPGQEDSLRSPLVLGLGGTAAVLALLGGIFFFMAGRQDAQEAFNEAKLQYEQAKYAQANELLLNFITLYKGHPLESEARRLRGLSIIDGYIEGAVKKWPEGLEALRSFINEQQKTDDFDSVKSLIAERAQKIALGATVAARQPPDRSLIQIGQEAATLLTTYLPEESRGATLNEIARVRRESEAALLKHETRLAALQAIQEYVPSAPSASAAEGDADAPAVIPRPIPALVEHRNLLASYPDLARDAEVVAAMNRILEAERSLVSLSEINATAITEEPAETALPTLSLVFHARSRTDVVSVGQCAYALSKDSLFGIDTVTGQPVWRRVIGFRSPFFPVEESSVPSLIVFDTNRFELCRIHRNTGELLWRQPIVHEGQYDDVRSHPLIHEGQILLPTMGGSLYQIDLPTGRLLAKLTFSQEITTPVPLPDGRLVVVGNEEVAYTLTTRPFECTSVSYLGQRPGSVAAPLLSMGPYVLMIENLTSNRARLRLLDVRNNTRLVQAASAEIVGEVYDMPVIRGRDLFVPSTGERVSTFSVSDDTNQPPLTAGPTFQVQGGGDNPVFLMTGPDRQLWMTSSALLKLQLTSTALAAEQGNLPVGEAAQPLQYQSGVIFNGRRRAYSQAVTLTPVDRDEQTSEWQAQVGASLLAVSPTASDPPQLICLTEEGGVFRITNIHWDQSTFGPDPSTRLPLNPELVDPLLATSLGGGQIAVACGDPEPKLWIINLRGEIERSVLLDAPLQAPPVLLGDGIVLPMQGRLRFQALRSGSAGVQDFSLPTDEILTSRWVQVVPLNETSLAALTSSGNLLLVARQTSPRPHLGEVSRIELRSAVSLPIQGDGQFLVVADVDHQVRVFETATLSLVEERTFDTGVKGAWSAQGFVFVQTLDDMLFVSGPDLTPLASLSMGSVLVGPPVITGEKALVTLQDGYVFTWDLATGEAADGSWLGVSLAQPPLRISSSSLGEELIFITVDGSLIRAPHGLRTLAGTPEGDR